MEGDRSPDPPRRRGGQDVRHPRSFALRHRHTASLRQSEARPRQQLDPTAGEGRRDSEGEEPSKPPTHPTGGEPCQRSQFTSCRPPRSRGSGGLDETV